MTKKMLIDAVHLDEARVAILHDNELYDYDFVTTSKTQLKGNIFLAKITRVEPSLQAAFVEYGNGRQGFLPFSEIHPDYYHMPVSDKQKLLEEQIAEAEAEEEEEEQAFEREQRFREERGNRRRKPSNSDESQDGEDELGNDADLSMDDDDAEDDTSDILLDDLDDETTAATTSYAALDAEDNFGISESILPPTDEEQAADVVETLDSHLDADAAVDASLNQETPDEENVTETGAPQRGRSGRPIAFYRRYRIQEVIKRNQVVLVQVTKEERGNKGCSLTTYISLAGRYCVLMPNSPKGGGISRKITDRDMRKQLKSLAAEMRTHKGMSVIIRTAGIDRDKSEIHRDYEYLVKLWNKIREETLASSAPALIYEEGGLIKRAIRDLYTNDIESIEIEGLEAYEEAKNFMGMLMPTHEEIIKPYSNTTPIFTHYGVDEELEEMLEPQVKLPSGGYIVINPTEALISIDVNSGRSTTERNVEETALKTNIEAAQEVARQMRLRDLAGIVVIDFIDMNYGKNRKQVERVMRDALKQDRAKIQLSRISIFGLMELSRQRMRPSISEAMSITCAHCKGIGIVHSPETVAMQAIRTLKKEAASGEYVALRISAPNDIALKLLNEKRRILLEIEAAHRVNIIITIDSSIITASFKLLKTTSDGKEITHDTVRQTRRRGRRGGSSNVARRTRHQSASDSAVTQVDALDEQQSTTDSGGTDEAANEKNSENSSKNRRGRRGGRNRRDKRNAADAPSSDDAQEQVTDSENAGSFGAEDATEGSDKPRNSRDRRGRRGGRNRRPAKNISEASAATQAAENGVVVSFSQGQEQTTKPSTHNQPSLVVGLSEVASSAASAPKLSDTSNEEAKPKRKGWWNLGRDS